MPFLKLLFLIVVHILVGGITAATSLCIVGGVGWVVVGTTTTASAFISGWALLVGARCDLFGER